MEFAAEPFVVAVPVSKLPEAIVSTALSSEVAEQAAESPKMAVLVLVPCAVVAPSDDLHKLLVLAEEANNKLMSWTMNYCPVLNWPRRPSMNSHPALMLSKGVLTLDILSA